MTIRKTGAADGIVTGAAQDLPGDGDAIAVTASAAWSEPDEEGLAAENLAADE